MNENSEPARTLLASLQEAGYFVTPRQLANWHRAGLLPKPTRKALGKGKGSVSFYPAGTSRQATAICGLQAQSGKHRLSDIGTELWWRGYPVSTAFIKGRLVWLITVLDDAIRFLSVEEELDRLDQGEFSSKSLRKLKRRTLGSSAETSGMLFSDAIVGLFKVITGDEASLDRREEDGLNELIHFFLPQNHNLDLPIISKGLPLGSLGNFSYVRERLAAITDDELDHFRKAVANWIPAITIVLGAASPSSSVNEIPSQFNMALVCQDFEMNLDLSLLTLWVLIALEGAVPGIDLEPPVFPIIAPERPDETSVHPNPSSQ
ncbi:hypothetical protein [Ferrimicrobium sp.]|jgi:hypothetical protein|uniref:hypothetical protein n=1 Tax=Ferrimicrobium sp. TaxID=2926050 RepID=UPI0027E433C6|nr:hypothetical protein [Ferrimicrobium sp.]